MQNSAQFGSFPDKNAKLKQEAVAFYAQHDVTGVLETLLNRMFLDRPEDVYGYMSEYFHRLSVKPVISNIKGWYELDSRGVQSLALAMECKINGINKTVCSYTHPIVGREEEKKEQLINSPPKGQQLKQKTKHGDSVEKEVSKEEEVVEEQEQEPPLPDVLDCLQHFVDKVKGILPMDQITIDRMITTAQISTSTLNDAHVTCQSAISHLTTIASSTLMETHPSFHLLNTFDKTNNRLSVPLPVMKFISGGQRGIGKLKVRSFSVSPSPTVDLTDGAKYVVSLYKEVGRQLALKQGPIGYATLPDGSYCMACDKPEQALELLKEAAVNEGLELNRELSLYIDIGADILYDIDKKKYEIITGQWKTADDLIIMYTSLLTAYPGLIGFIDPLHPKDIDGWSSLINQLGDKCLLICDTTCSELFPVEETTNGDDKKTTDGDGTVTTDQPDGDGTVTADQPDGDGTVTTDQPDGDGREKTDKSLSFISCSSLRSNGNYLISDYFKDAKKLRGHSRYLMLSVNDYQTVDSLKVMVDMAVALNCKFIKLCAPAGLGSTVALSRLVKLQGEMKAQSLHRPSSALLFSCAQQAADDHDTESS